MAGARYRRLLLAALVLGFSVGISTPAAAQTDCIVEPYSGGQLCQPSSVDCELDQDVIDNGTRVRVQGRGFEPDQGITGFFDGEVVFELHTDDGTFDVTFTIPERPPGQYNVIVRSDTGQECDPPVIIPGDTEVLGVSFERGGSGASVERGSASSGRSDPSGGTRVLGLSVTGSDFLRWILAAVALILTGLALRRFRRRGASWYAMDI